MRVLCLETSADRCSVALFEDGRMIGYRYTDEERAHSRKLTLFIEDIFKELGLAPRVLDAVAYSKGPGSYTGLRVGLSNAKGLAFALDIPMIGISTSRIFYEGVRKDHDADLYVTLQDARRMEAYASAFSRDGKELSSDIPTILDEDWKAELLEKGNKIVLTGTGAEKVAGMFESVKNVLVIPAQPDAKNMGALAAASFEKKEFENILLAEPKYVKSPNITQPRRKTP